MSRFLLPLVAFLALIQPLVVAAGVERVATVCESGICFHWWPQVKVPAGWAHDNDHSLHYNFNALAPEGRSFADAEAVMYANAIYRPSVPEAKTLQEFIDNDHANFRRDSPDIAIEMAPELRTSDGKTVHSWTLSPKSQGQWERVAYFEEGEYIMVFVISSRTSTGLQREMSSFEHLVTGYTE